MTLSTLSLPIDIPWNRLARSEDMDSLSAGDPLPRKWRSSLAIFSYEPVPDPEVPSNPDERTTFLKIIATVTGYQPNGGEIDAGPKTTRFMTQVVTNANIAAGKYYPALSALLQVAVYPDGLDPQGNRWGLAQFPYLSDFEPKKREVIELVSDTGETVTQSGTDIKVTKGTTTTNKTEDVNIDRGGSFAANISTPYGGGGFSTSHQQEVGTRNLLGTEAVNVINTDASREKRESLSHTTSLSQLYQLLDSYHAGLNRAVFFLNARPHIIDSPYTFVNGPRRLEGIQEFFLAVRRPKDMKICVKALLETAHLCDHDITYTTGTTVYDQQQIQQTFTLHTGSDFDRGQWTMTIPAGYHLDRSRGGGTYHFEWDDGSADSVVPAGVSYICDWTTHDDNETEAIPNITTFDDHVEIRAAVYGYNVGSDGRETLNMTVYTISDNPTETPVSHTDHLVDLFLTAREVTTCAEREVIIMPSKYREYVSWEKSLSPGTAAQLRLARDGGRPGAIAANSVSRDVHDAVINAVGANDRYPEGEVGFFASNAFIRQVQTGLESLQAPELDEPLHKVAPANLRRTIKRVAPEATVGQVLKAAPADLARAFGISEMEARDLLLRAVGVVPSGGVQGPQRGATTGVSVASRSTAQLVTPALKPQQGPGAPSPSGGSSVSGRPDRRGSSSQPG